MGNQSNSPTKPKQDEKAIEPSKKPTEKQPSDSQVKLGTSFDDVVRDLAARIKVETTAQSLKRLTEAKEIRLVVQPAVLPWTRNQFVYSLQKNGCWSEVKCDVEKTHTEVKELHCGPNCFWLKPKGCSRITSVDADGVETVAADTDAFHLAGKLGKEDEQITSLPILNVTKGELQSFCGWLEKFAAGAGLQILFCAILAILLPNLQPVGLFILGALDVLESKAGAIIMWWNGIREEVYSYKLIEVREATTKDFISCNANLHSWPELSCSISSCFGIAKAGRPMVSLRALNCGTFGCRAGAIMPLAQRSSYATNFARARSERFEVEFGSKGQIERKTGAFYPEPCDFFLPLTLQFLWLEIVTITAVLVLVLGGYLLLRFRRGISSTKITTHNEPKEISVHPSEKRRTKCEHGPARQLTAPVFGPSSTSDTSL